MKCLKFARGASSKIFGIITNGIGLLAYDVFITMTFADKVITFYKNLSISNTLPGGVEVLNPYQNKETFELCRLFYKRYYDDKNQRIAILGINPGRFGITIKSWGVDQRRVSLGRI